MESLSMRSGKGGDLRKGGERLFSRRDVVGTGAASLAAVVLSSGFGSWSGLAHASEGDDSTASDEETVVPSACRNCYGRCTINGIVRNGRLVKVEPLAGTYSEGTCCSKAFAIPDLIYSPKRIVYPMKQVGERGSGRWKRISWEEAWDIIIPEFEDALEKHGGESIMYNNGTARDQFNIHAMQKVFHDLGSVGGFGVGSVCKMGGDGVQRAVVGNPCSWANWDAEHSNMIIFWGHGLFADGAYTASIIDRARSNGAAFVVVDPRYTEAAQRADLWLAIRPGTDLALALCLIREMLDTGRFDKDFTAAWTNAGFLVNPETSRLLRASDRVSGGSDKVFYVANDADGIVREWNCEALSYDADDVVPRLRGPVLFDGEEYPTCLDVLHDTVREWTVEKTAEITWLAQEDIRCFLDMYMQSSPGVCFSRGQKMDMSNNASGMSHAINIFMALGGNYEAEGGNWVKAITPFMPYVMFHAATEFPEAKKHMLENLDTLAFGGATAKVYGQQYGYPASATHVLRTFDPFEPRIFWESNADAVLMAPGSREVFDVLNHVHFHVECDYQLTPAGEIADVFLPAAHHAEVDRVEYPTNNPTYPANQTAVIRQPFVEPPGECMDEVDIMFELARRLDIDMHWKDKYDWFDFQLKPAGVTFDEFKSSVHKVMVENAPYGKHETGGLRADHRPGFQTASGKVEIFSETLANFGHGPVPFYIEQAFSPISESDMYGGGEGEYPLVLLSGGRVQQFFHTEYRESPLMRSIHPYPLLQINPSTAKKYGIESGDWVKVESPWGSCYQVARCTQMVDPRMVHAEHGWWYPELSRDEGMHGAWISNINMVYPAPDALPCDPATGALPYNMLVRVTKAERPAGILEEERLAELAGEADGFEAAR